MDADYETRVSRSGHADVPRSSVNGHYQSMGSIDRYWIQPFTIDKQDVPGVLVECVSSREKYVAGEFARYFHIEMGFDSPPFEASSTDPDVRTFLIRDRMMTGTDYEMTFGAVGIRSVKSSPVLTWIWVHPWRRQGVSQHDPLFARAHRELVKEVGELFYEAPLSLAMKGALKRVGVDPDARARRIVYGPS